LIQLIAVGIATTLARHPLTLAMVFAFISPQVRRFSGSGLDLLTGTFPSPGTICSTAESLRHVGAPVR